MSAVLVVVAGCDDNTAVVVELTDEQLATARMIADAVSAASTYGCQPTMTVTVQP